MVFDPDRPNAHEEEKERRRAAEKARQEKEEADLRSIRALQGAPIEGCGDDDCDDCYPK